jgi:tetratricopeptide (TPR) repeat protein
MRPGVPATVATAVTKAMAKDPADRFATAAEFGAAITDAVASTSGSTAARVRGRRVRAAILAGSATVALAAAAFVVMRDPSAGAAATVDESAVAILPFRVRGEASLQYLREGMVDLLAAKLTGEGGLRAADPRAVYAGWRRVVARETDDLPVDSGVALAGRLGAGNVLVGDVVGSPAGIVVNASVMNARGRVVGRATAQGAHTDLSALVDQLVAQLLTASAGEEPQRLGTLTTTSLPALRAYLEGQAAYRRGRYTAALEQFGRAIDLDSTFALAGLGLSLADGWVGTGHARDRGRAVAWRWRERLSPRDHALLVAHVGPAYPRDPTVREQLTTIEEALRLAPDRVELWYALGDLHFHFGRIFGGGDWTAQAERALRRAVEGDSGFAPAIHHLVGLYAMEARRDDLRALVPTALAVAGEGSTADFVRWRVAEALGQSPLPVAALDSMATETIGWISLISQDEGIVVPLGERATQIRYERPTTSQDRFWRLLSVHAGALNGGRPRAAAALTENMRGMRGMQSDSAFYLRLRVLSALYGDGDRAAGERAAAALGTVARDGAWRLNRCVRELWLLVAGTTSATTPLPPDGRRAALSPAEQHCESAVNAMRSSAQRTPAAARSLARLDEVTRTIAAELYLGDGHFDYAHIALARLLEASGDTAGALVAIRRRPYFIGWQPFLAASLRHEGRLAAAIGDREGAIRAYEHHLALRYAPEESLRASADSVRGELARLQSGR